jgi:hypothetical protein
LDFEVSYPLDDGSSWSDTALDASTGTPVYRSKSKLAEFRQYHCPPFSAAIVIDEVWREIISRFVPSNKIQFFPVRLFARDGVTDEFSWVIPFDRAECIDIKKSEITNKIEKPGLFYVLNMKTFYHVPGCLCGKHIARDKHMESHLVVSDTLKEALCTTGQCDVFRKPEDMSDYYV